MRFKCEFPNCGYETNIKSQIHKHHIVPKEIAGLNKKFNTIWLCPTHHTKIYCPESKRGIHTIKGPDSIILIGWKQSTNGKILEFIDENGLKDYFLYK